MNYWLLKSEPDVWSIDQQMQAGVRGATWDGVEIAGCKFLKAMIGDLCLPFQYWKRNRGYC